MQDMLPASGILNHTGAHKIEFIYCSTGKCKEFKREAPHAYHDH